MYKETTPSRIESALMAEFYEGLETIDISEEELLEGFNTFKKNLHILKRMISGEVVEEIQNLKRLGE